jgi:hypothetical protein
VAAILSEGRTTATARAIVCDNAFVHTHDGIQGKGVDGNGAVRQRRAFQRRGRVQDVVAVLARDTLQDCMPETAV